jgi:hypothetical protein
VLERCASFVCCCWFQAMLAAVCASPVQGCWCDHCVSWSHGAPCWGSCTKVPVRPTGVPWLWLPFRQPSAAQTCTASQAIRARGPWVKSVVMVCKGVRDCLSAWHALDVLAGLIWHSKGPGKRHQQLQYKRERAPRCLSSWQLPQTCLRPPTIPWCVYALLSWTPL